MKEFFSKKEPTTALRSEQWAEFKEKQLCDTRSVLERLAGEMSHEKYTRPDPEVAERHARSREALKTQWREQDEQRQRTNEKLRAAQEEFGFTREEWWGRWFNFFVPRHVIDPRGEIKNAKDVDRLIDLWLLKNGFDPDKVQLGGDIREYPEYIDHRIRDVMIKLNSLPFIKTLSSCSGHGTNDPESQNKVVGYDYASFNFIINKNLPGAELFLKILHTTIRNFNEPLSEIIFKKDTYWELESMDKGVEIYTVRFRRKAPSRKWLERHRKPYLIPIAQLPGERKRFNTFLDETLKGASIPVHDESRERLEGGYFENIEKEYADYPTSEEAKKRTDEFWRKIGELADQFSAEHQS